MPRPLNQTDTDLNADNLLRLPAEFGCPVWVYDAQIVREKIAALHQFEVVRFAQKACSNIHILRLMREQGVKVDSVSLGEIERALAGGFRQVVLRHLLKMTLYRDQALELVGPFLLDHRPSPSHEYAGK